MGRAPFVVFLGGVPFAHEVSMTTLLAQAAFRRSDLWGNSRDVRP